RPETRERRLGVSDIYRKPLVPPGLLVFIQPIRAGEIHAAAVRRPLPCVDTGGMFRKLLGLRGVETRNGQTIQLARVGPAAPVHEMRAIRTDREVVDAVTGVRDLSSLPAIGTHPEDLVLRRCVRRRFAIRQKEEGLAVRGPGWRGFVLRGREGHLL